MQRTNVQWMFAVYTLCLKKVPTFELSVTLPNHNRYSKFLYCWKAYEICYKTHATLPTSLRHVATLPWDIKHSNFLQIFSRYWKKMQTKCIFILCNFVIHSQILIFSVFKTASLSSYWLQVNFFMSLFFTYLLLRPICGTGNSSQQTPLQCLSTVNMVFRDEDKVLIKTLFAISMEKDSLF